jgi:hypothetical protein
MTSTPPDFVDALQQAYAVTEDGKDEEIDAIQTLDDGSVF